MSTDSKTHKFTYEHYVLYPNDGKRHEIIDGDHYMNAAPNPLHQLIAGRIYRQLLIQIEDADLGLVFGSPIDIRMTEHDVVQPDLTVVLSDRKRMFTKQTFDGAPNLVIEILSPSTTKNDRTLKKDLYEKVGVDEYWIVDPENKSVEQHVLTNSRYKLSVCDVEIKLSILPDVTVSTVGIWEF